MSASIVTRLHPRDDRAGIFVNVVDYLADVPDDVPWVAPPFAFFGGVTLLAGIWKGGKSTLVAQLQRARETGEPFLGSAVPIGPTVLVTEEGGIPVKRKCAGLTKLVVLDRKSAAILGLTLDGLIDALGAYCDRQDKPAVIVIDTFAVWSDVDDENDAGEVTRVISKFATLSQRTGAAVILNDHVRKEGGSHGRVIRGSGAKAATVDVFAVLDYTNGGLDTDRSLELEGRVIEPTKMRLAFNPSTKKYTVSEGAGSASERNDRSKHSLVAKIKAEGPVTRDQLGANGGRSKIDFDALLRDGAISKTGTKNGRRDLYWTTDSIATDSNRVAS